MSFLLEKFVGSLWPYTQEYCELYADPTPEEWDHAIDKSSQSVSSPTGGKCYMLRGLWWGKYVFIWSYNTGSHQSVINGIDKKYRKLVGEDNDFLALNLYYMPNTRTIAVDYAPNSPNSKDRAAHQYAVPPDFMTRLQAMAKNKTFKPFNVVTLEGTVIKQLPTPRGKKPATLSEILVDELFEKIIRVGKKYRLVSRKTGKNLGTYPTKAGALKRERQIQFFKHRG